MVAVQVGGKQHHFPFYFIYDTIKYGNKKRGRMWLPLPAQKTSVSHPHHYPSASYSIGWRDGELTGERKASRAFLISAVFQTREKNRNEKAEERKVLQYGLSYDGGFFFGTTITVFVTIRYFDTYVWDDFDKYLCTFSWLTEVLLESNPKSNDSLVNN